MPQSNTHTKFRLPLFTTADFVPTQWDTASDKASFANHLINFIANRFSHSIFTEKFYSRLSTTFGHIAHHNRNGFWNTFFEDTNGKVSFLEHLARWPCHGDPEWTYSDVELAVQRRIVEAKLLENYRAELAAEQEGAQRALLQRLKSKYEPASTK